MRTTFDLPESLLKSAMSATGAKTKKQAIIISLEEAIRKQRLADLANAKGRFNITYDINHDRRGKR